MKEVLGIQAPNSARTRRPPSRGSPPGSWEELQRRLTRRAGQVSPFEEPKPRLLVAAENPECWDRMDMWPEVARATSRLPPSNMPQHEEAESIPSLQDLLPWVREAFGEDFVEQQFPSDVLAVSSKVHSFSRSRQKRPAQAHDIGLKTPPSVTLQAAHPKSLRQNLDKLMSSLQGGQESRPDWAGIDRQPRTIARQNFDLFRDPFGAADEFTLATRKAERRINARRIQEEDAVSTETVQSPRKHKISRKPQSEVRGHILERLDYLNFCRGTMGESRFAMQRRRLEMQGHLRSAEKYSVEERPMQVRCAFSAQARGGKTTPWDPDLLQALSRPATAEHGQAQDEAGSLVIEETKPMKNSEAVEDNVASTFRFASQCAANKMAMPTFGCFTLQPGARDGLHQETQSQLSVPNWSLGDQPLLALASSPLKENLAGLSEGNFRGNRISNNGVQAIVSNLGSQLVKLDLSANSFDSSGLEALQRFVIAGTTLTDLDLSSNRLSDRAVSKLCLQLSQHCPDLRRLSLSDVMIGHDQDTGAALGSLAVAIQKLRFLDVSFNTLHGQGAVAFLRGLVASRLRCLDVSWNCLGKGSCCKAVADEVAAVLIASETLQHLDISFNSMHMQEMEILSKGLEANRSLWGLHVDGNAGIVDMNGFLVVPQEHVLEDVPRPKATRMTSKKGKAGNKAVQKSKEHSDADINVAGMLLTPQELEARLQALQWHLRLHDLSEEYRKKVEQEAQEEREEARSKIASGSMSLTLVSRDPCTEEDVRMALSLPELIRRLPSGQPMSPRSQEEMLQNLALETRQETTTALRDKMPREAAGELYLQSWKASLNFKHNNCWICNGWVEVLIQVYPGDLGVEFPNALDVDLTICALMSVDNFSQPVLLREEEGRWTGSRFLPPAERIFMVIQMGNQLTVHRRLPTRMLLEPLTIPLRSSAAPEGGSSTVFEINVLRVGSLAAAYCRGEPDASEARVICTAAEKAAGITLDPSDHSPRHCGGQSWQFGAV